MTTPNSPHSLLVRRNVLFRSVGSAVLPVVCFLAFLADDASGSTVGYWRFEDGAWLTDSSGNGYTLTSRGSGAPTQYTLPGSGPGSDFPNPVPQNGLANSNATTFGGSGWLTAADSPAFTTNTFTIEAFVNATNLSMNYSPFIASHFYSSGTNERSWGLAVNRNDGSNDGQLQMILSVNGQTGTGNTEVIRSGSSLALTAGSDYYVGATVSLGAAPADRSVTFYLRDLTSGGLLLSNTVSHSITNLFNSSAEFAIGGQGGTSGASLFQGVIDEVRFSNAILAESDLLMVPEPSTYALLGLAAAGLAGHVIRRRRR